MKRWLLALAVVGSLGALADAAPWGGYGYGPRFGFRGYQCGPVGAAWAYRSAPWSGPRYSAYQSVGGYYGNRPYWFHPYYARFGFMRPYQYYRVLRTFGPGAFHGTGWGAGWGWGGGCGGGAYYFSYYPAAISVAPIYSRLGVALTLDGWEFDGPRPAPAGDADGLPRERTTLVGSRFLVDAK